MARVRKYLSIWPIMGQCYFRLRKKLTNHIYAIVFVFSEMSLDRTSSVLAQSLFQNQAPKGHFQIY